MNAATTERQPIRFGLPGVTIEPGDHLCAFYRGDEERDELLQAYLGAGIDEGDACYAIIDTTDPGRIADLFDNSEHLTVTTCDEAHLRSGEFDPSDMIAYWDESVRGALEQATSTTGFFRAAAEMTWSLRDVPGVDQLAAFESSLNDFLPKHNQVIVCLYDLRKFSGDIVIDMLKTHPKVVLGGSAFENPYYVTPDEFLAGLGS